MPKKLIICAHGIGDFQSDFHEAWAEVLHRNHGSDRFKVVGLFWDDIQDELFDKFFDLPAEIKKIAEDSFLKHVYQYLTDPSHARIVKFLKENAFDTASYLLLKEFRNATLWPKCSLRLIDLINQYKTYQPVLIGHSLGSVMLTHTTWYIRHMTGGVNLHDFFLIGSPMGFRSSVPQMPDFLSLLAEVGNHDSRLDALTIWAGNSYHHSRNRLHILINENDPVAWDAKSKIVVDNAEVEFDVFPMRQGFSTKEIKRIENANPETVTRFKAGSNDLTDIMLNHDVLRYLESNPFKETFEAML